MMKRVLFAVAGGATGAGLVALVEARSASLAGTGANAPSFSALALGTFGALVPLALGCSLVVALASLFLEPKEPLSLAEHAARIRSQPVFLRSRTAAIAPLAVLVAFAFSVATAHLATAELAHGAPLEAGLSLAVSSLGVLLLFVACALALLPPLRRALAAGAHRLPRLIDPIATGVFALVLATLAVAWGVGAGNTSGVGGGVLGVFGVLKRGELDLRPLINLIAIAMCAYLSPVAFSRRPRAKARVVVAAVLVAAPLLVTIHEATAGNRDLAVVRSIERNAPLGKIGLALVRRATDRDKDGFSPYFGGGDCDDHDPRRNPNAIDVPGNGIDEDCTGADAPLPVPTRPPPPPPPRPSDRAYNVILITIDTLRIELGFMGYPKAVSPNLDKLAARATVFERAYAMASYTGKSIGPMMIGKYPSETLRDGSHFNAYYPDNVMLAERLRAAGVHTIGAMSHWYFGTWSGLHQGFDVWDLSAKPAGMGDNDSTVTSDLLSDSVLKILAKPENVTPSGDGGQARFFAWFHYFDPHAQYAPHPGAPDFAAGEKGGAAQTRGAYDAEVWFTDKHVGRVLDYVAEQPWAKDTAIVVTADHGEAFGEHNMSWHGAELWEPLVRVPLLVYVPGRGAHRVPVKRSHIDLVPTILDLMKVPLPAEGEIAGQSLLPDVMADGGFPERDVYLDMPAGPFNGTRRAIIHGDTPGLKLIHLGAGQYQLFDLAADPGEKEDLASDKEKLDPMVAAMQAVRSRLKEIEVKPDAP